MKGKLKIARPNHRAALILIILFSLFAFACQPDDAEALRSAKGKYSFQEISTYEISWRDSRYKLIKQRHKIILLNEKISKNDLTVLARLLLKAYPNTGFQFFDDKSQVSEYAEWDRANNGRGNYVSSPFNLYVYKHRVAEIKVEKDYNGYNKWFLVFGGGSPRTEL